MKHPEFVKCTTCGFDRSKQIEAGEKSTYQCPACKKTFLYPPEPRIKAAVSGAKENETSFKVELFEYARSRVVEIISKGVGQGSGFIFSKGGYIMTNAHVITKMVDDRHYIECPEIYAKFKNEDIAYELEIISCDMKKDLAILKFVNYPQSFGTTKFTPIDKKILPGEDVCVIGNGRSLGTTMTSGIVSDEEKIINGEPVIQIDSPVNNGNSGGPVFNIKKEVIGVVVSGLDTTLKLDEQGRIHGLSVVSNISFCIPASVAIRYIKTIGEGKDIDFGI